MVDGRRGDRNSPSKRRAIVSIGGNRALVTAKLIETASRGVFVIAGTYSLSLEQSGRFGIMVTLIGLFAFAAGFERQIELQRRLVGESDAAVHAQFSDAIRLYFLNHILLSPLLIWGLHVWCDLTLVECLAAVVIVIAEQCANQTYQVALISTRFRWLIFLAAGKNVALITCLVLAWLQSGRVEFTWVVSAWLAASLAFITIGAIVWWRLGGHLQRAAAPKAMREQYMASAYHFLIGLVAIMSLQADRLLVATLLTAEEIGTFYRNVVLTSVGYVIFNVVFVGRLMPQVFLRAKSESTAALQGLLWREWRVVVAVAAIVLGIVAAAPHVSAALDPGQLGIRLDILFWLLMAFIIRAAADLEGLVLNSRRLEALLLRNQAAALAIGLLATAIFAHYFGAPGAASGGVVLAAVYLYLNSRTLKYAEASP